MSKKVMLLALAAIGAALARRAAARRGEDELWNEATAPPDLR